MTLLAQAGLRTQQGLLSVEGLKTRTGLLVPASGGGGGGFWTADFANGVYTLAGVSCAVTDLFAQDADNWASWDPATDIVPGSGMTAPNSGFLGPVLIGTALTAAIAGATYVVELTFPAIAASQVQLLLTDFPDFAGNQGGIALVNTGGNHSAVQSPQVDTAQNLADGAHKFALTIQTDHVAMSLDGGTVFLTDVAATSPTAFGIDSAEGAVIASITAVAAVADSELPALST